MERESMEVDVLIVGGGPSGLSAACHIMQLAQQAEQELTVCVVEKGSEVGAHILSGAVFELSALNELFADWKERAAPVKTEVKGDDIYLLRSQEKATKLPGWAVPKTMHNQGNYIISLGNLCRWLSEQAAELGVEVYPGFAAAEILYNEDGSVKGIATGDMGVSASGERKDSFQPGFEFHAKYTLFAEGCRGHLGKQLLSKYELDKDADPQHYGIGIKELWDITPDKHQPGLVVHTGGWPLSESGSSGGGFLYHTDDNQVALGLIVDLSYSNPHVSPFDEFQRFKHNPVIKKHLEGGKRVAYGARAIAKGGLNSLPKMTFPGGLLIGCDAGTLNFAKIKGTHTAMKSGMLAAKAVVDAIISGSTGGDELTSYSEAFKASSIQKELYKSRNFGPALHKYGTFIGGAFNFLDQNIFRGKLPFTLHDTAPDHTQLKDAASCPTINYLKPDGTISFDKLSSVFLSNTNHEEDQPCHLKLTDPDLPLRDNLPRYDEPAQRYCPAGVYEIIEDAGEKQFQINSQNCVHCKTCDIKDPAQNITWVVPEGSGGPNYPNM